MKRTKDKLIIGYHVASPSYKPGQTLLSYREAEARGIPVKWHWDYDPADDPDADLVCLHNTLEEALLYREEYSGGCICEVAIALLPGDEHLPDDEIVRESGLALRQHHEGYIGIVNEVPSEFVSVLPNDTLDLKEA